MDGPPPPKLALPVDLVPRYRLNRELRALLFAAGDSPDADDETVALLAELVWQYLGTMLQRAIIESATAGTSAALTGARPGWPFPAVAVDDVDVLRAAWKHGTAYQAKHTRAIVEASRATRAALTIDLGAGQEQLVSITSRMPMSRESAMSVRVRGEFERSALLGGIRRAPLPPPPSAAQVAAAMAAAAAASGRPLPFGAGAPVPVAGMHHALAGAGMALAARPAMMAGATPQQQHQATVSAYYARLVAQGLAPAAAAALAAGAAAGGIAYGGAAAAAAAAAAGGGGGPGGMGMGMVGAARPHMMAASGGGYGGMAPTPSQVLQQQQFAAAAAAMLPPRGVMAPHGAVAAGAARPMMVVPGAAAAAAGAAPQLRFMMPSTPPPVPGVPGAGGIR